MIKSCFVLPFLIATLLFSGCSTNKPKHEGNPHGHSTTTTPDTEIVGPFITDVIQRSFDGIRAGEGYFSKDGSQLIFQSERESKNPFYQIYLMDLKTGQTKRLSPGMGKTTCAWLHPTQALALFSSTHQDPKLKAKTKEEWDSRKSDKKAKYSWSFDDQFDIYQTDLNGKKLKNLTHTLGYDAEGSYSPDGKWIAFASNRQAYGRKLSAEEQILFDRDPSYFMDLYIMRADGTDLKQITNVPGYDGGPFFSPDGKRLTFRRFSVDGSVAEVHTISIDGSDDRQLTNIKAMSWAPFYHPSNDYIIFTTNKMGYANFELYIVDTAGKKQPVRVSKLEGFDGLPVFTPDGNELVWTHTNVKGEAQLHRAKWNDALARKALNLPAAKTANTNSIAQTPDTSAAKKWVEYLASEKLQGRMTGGPTESEYMGALAAEFGKLGLKPINKSFLHPYSFTSGIKLQEKTKLELTIRDKQPTLIVGQDWTPLSFSKTGQFTKEKLTFVGYGIVAPAAGGQDAYDSYATLDVKNKWVVAFADLPNDISNERRFHLHLYSRLQHKAMMARQHGAIGLIIIDDALAPIPSMKLQFEGRSQDAGIPVLRLSSNIADQLFAAENTSRGVWTKKLATGLIEGFEINTSSASATIDLSFSISQAQNIVAVLKVPGAKSTILVGAHGDHLGHGEMGNSLWRGTKGAIHLGADDNASGVAGVMEIATDLAQKYKSGNLKLKQNIMFAIWSGEEIGILGSNAFIKANPKLKISAYLNMDMIGRFRDHFMIQGTASAPEWTSWIEQVNTKNSLPIRTQEDPYLPTDAMAFYLAKIPILSIFTGSHSEYHMPTDRPELIDYDNLVRAANWIGEMSVTLASQAKPVTYQKVDSTKKVGEGRGFRLYLGTIPDYSQEGKTGVSISGTSKDSPAEKAGVQAGDIVVELGGMKIQNLYDYVYCLQALKANIETPLKVMRAGAEKTLTITPIVKTQ